MNTHPPIVPRPDPAPIPVDAEFQCWLCTKAFLVEYRVPLDYDAVGLPVRAELVRLCEDHASPAVRKAMRGKQPALVHNCQGGRVWPKPDMVSQDPETGRFVTDYGGAS